MTGVQTCALPISSSRSVVGRLSHHISTYRIQLLVLVALLTTAYLLPASAVDPDEPPVNYWNWRTLNRQEAASSSWLVDTRGVTGGTVANGGWDRGKKGLLVVPKESQTMRRHPIEVLIKVSPPR